MKLALAAAIMQLASIAPDRAYELGRYFDAAATSQAVDPALLVALGYHESAFRADAVSPAGAVGIMQLMPVWLNRQASEAEHILTAARVVRIYQRRCYTMLRALRALGAYRSGRCTAGPRAHATMEQARLVRRWLALPRGRLERVVLP